MNRVSTLVVGCLFFALLVPALARVEEVRTTPGKVAQSVVPAVTAIDLQQVLAGLDNPVYVTSARDGSNRLFIVERKGKIKVLQPGATTPTVFLDIMTLVESDAWVERGLLGLAFHPNYETNRRFFVHYTREPDGAIVIAEYRTSVSDPNIADTTETPLLVVPHPFVNHNGGMVEFGPDGYLYIALGDGGGPPPPDPDNRAQNINDLLGKILRINIDQPSPPLPYSSPPDNPFVGVDGRDEIYALGFRNPWRFSFDRGPGNALYAADVGEAAREEIDIVTRGGNYGWRVFEGRCCRTSGVDALCNPAPPCGPNDPPPCSQGGMVCPIAEYLHDGSRCSITGGYVYRGPISTLPMGAYVYADFCSGEIFLLEGSPPLGTPPTLLLDTNIGIASFGEDEQGEIYVVGLGDADDATGTIHRIVNPNAACSFTVTPASMSFNGFGGAGNVVVTAPVDCDWTAASNDTWITITSGGNGTGYGVVNYSVAAIDRTTPRTGTITIAGQTFTVIQSADSDGDGIPDIVEVIEGTNPLIKDNDIFANARLFVMQQYRDFLGREGDSGGISFWTGQISSGALTRAQVIQSFFNSAEFQSTTAPITRLYFAFFLRIPDYGGLRFWIDSFRRGISLAAIADFFAQSAEFQTRYGSLNNTDFVTLVYNNVLGRAPDAGGLAFWVGQLDSGMMTRGQVMLEFSESAEFRVKSFNKVFVVQMYVGMLRRAPDTGGFNFWVGLLNGGASGLSLIQGFLDSTEYRNRFLPPAAVAGLSFVRRVPVSDRTMAAQRGGVLTRVLGHHAQRV